MRHVHGCIYARRNTFTNAGCDNADVANYCISSSPSPSPSSSLSRAGECDRRGYLVGQQCSSLSGKPGMDCAFSNRFSWVFMGRQMSSNPTDKLAKEMKHDLEVNFNKIAPFGRKLLGRNFRITPWRTQRWRKSNVRSFACCHHQRVRHDCQVGNPSHRRVHRWTAAHGLFKRFQRRLPC